MKSLSPPSKAAIAILASAMSASANYNAFPYATPAFRYESYGKLDTTSQNIASEKLGYLPVTWNNHGLAPIERKGWDNLTSNERDAATTIGFTENTWDCFINHYEQHSWEELAEEGVQEHYRNLGWDEGFWTHETEGVPYTDARWWDQLTSTEKLAANKLCYFQENWDKVDMNPNDSFFPYPMPDFRYSPWDELPYVTRNTASGMMNYTQELWDNLGTHVVEKNTFLNLDPIEREGAMELGFYIHNWDCFMNHYQAYFWSSFQQDLKVAITTLGWTEDMWVDNASEAPASEAKMWVDLTSEEKAAATRLCYFREIWDDEPIANWYDYDAGKTMAIPGEGPVPKDIDLDIFADTGYVGRAPGDVGVEVYTVADIKSSSYRVVTSSALALVVSMGVFIFV
mmetsp:Transcript_9894/g.22230  ORF Transcript_9894/g.22230 Transcript_9894/m.22230 type:complete len:398 (+) Transcript_9894:134-1327(+)